MVLSKPNYSSKKLGTELVSVYYFALSSSNCMSPHRLAHSLVTSATVMVCMQLAGLEILNQMPFCHVNNEWFLYSQHTSSCRLKECRWFFQELIQQAQPFSVQPYFGRLLRFVHSICPLSFRRYCLQHSWREFDTSCF